MATFHLKFVVSDIDRYGTVRHYFRQKGKPKIRLPAMPGSQEFMAAYQAALEGRPLPTKRKLRPQVGRAAPGTFHALVQAYYASAEWKRLDRGTKDWRRRILDEIAAVKGDAPVALMEPRHVRQMRDAKAETPAAANNLVKALRALFGWAIEAEKANRNPAKDVKLIRYVSKGFHSWTLEEVKQFEDRYPVGTPARLALALLLYTTGRREDVVRLGPEHIRNGRLKYTQAKNEHRNPVYMDIPVHPDLAAIIAATPSGQPTFLVTSWNRPFSAAGFGNKFREWCDGAGLPHCSAHGLRKATAARLAEKGATAHEIMAITGHKTLTEAERYTRAARQAGLADSAMSKL